MPSASTPKNGRQTIMPPPKEKFKAEKKKVHLWLKAQPPQHYTHTRTRTRAHSVPALSHCDADGANMRDVSGVARERYLWPRWKPNAVNCTSCLPNHFSQREMAGQDKLVIWQKTIHLERRRAVCKGKPPFCSPECHNGREIGLADLDGGGREAIE